MCRDYRRVESIIHRLDENHLHQPSLKELAASAGMSEFTLQRLFSRWAGISPKRFLQFLTLERNKSLLRQTHSILSAGESSGLSSVSRVHDLFINCHAMTPGEYRRLGAGREITYGLHETPFGECLLAANERGICNLLFVATDQSATLKALSDCWPAARLTRNRKFTRKHVDKIFTRTWSNNDPLYVNLKGTGLQIQVWQALLRIPEGRLISYEDLADASGAPHAVRAVANAVARNPIHYLIPCHRVIRKTGAFGGYRGGLDRKKALIAWESIPSLEAESA
ncbi:MAG: Bifunctional transcriptional activator/DNA repair enzyme Ada [Gammaproteobacteria bacterium]|nr:Bifunctional transcriptional activator/DNA repair enzyme Ada [Gammaproteobacteria bacterium]